jgi:hypothetical protein
VDGATCISQARPLLFFLNPEKTKGPSLPHLLPSSPATLRDIEIEIYQAQENNAIYPCVSGKNTLKISPLKKFKC